MSDIATRPQEERRFSPRDYPFYYIAQVRRKNTTAIGRLLKPYGVSTNMWRILGALQERDGVSIGEIANIIVIERTQLGRLLHQMENDGLVRRASAESDRRHTLVSLTEAGRERFESVLPVMLTYYERICSGIPATEMKAFMQDLQIILNNLDGGFGPPATG